MLPVGFRTLTFLSNPCGPSPCDRLSLSPTTMAAPTPFRHVNRNLSSPEGGRLGLPRSLFGPLRRWVGRSCTPVRCRLTPSSPAAGLYLDSHCRFARCEGLLAVPHAKVRLPGDFHAISIVCQRVDPLGASDRVSWCDLTSAQAGGLGVMMECCPVPRVLRASDRFLVRLSPACRISLSSGEVHCRPYIGFHPPFFR